MVQDTRPLKSVLEHKIREKNLYTNLKQPVSCNFPDWLFWLSHTNYANFISVLT